MSFNVGQTVFLKERGYIVDALKPRYITLRTINGDDYVLLKSEEFEQHYLSGELYSEGYLSPASIQRHLSEKKQERMAYRKPYALCFAEGVPNFDRGTLTRDQFVNRLIQKIAAEHKHTKVPSRASCYRWAKKYLEAGRDLTALA